MFRGTLKVEANLERWYAVLAPPAPAPIIWNVRVLNGSELSITRRTYDCDSFSWRSCVVVLVLC